MTNHYESYGFRRILEEFIDTYRNQPCLWQMKHEDYHNREKKTNAYNKLIVLYKKIEPKADRDTIVKKINALRTTYRKEKKKVEESKLSGTEYVPTLWYFNLLKFLDDDQTMIKSSRSSVDEIDCYQVSSYLTHINNSNYNHLMIKLYPTKVYFFLIVEIVYIMFPVFC